MNHLIGQQIIDLQLSPELEAATIQHQFSQLYWQELVPELDQLFNQLTTADEVITIDRLEIDLGHFAPSELRKEIILPMITHQIKDWLSKNNKNKHFASKQQKAKSIFDKWLFFLKNGYLPWSLKVLPKDWEEKILASLAENKLAFQQLAQLLMDYPYTQQRLIQQYKASFLQKIITTFTAKKQVLLADFAINLPTPKAANQFWAFVINQTLLQQQKLADKALIKAYQKAEKTDILSIITTENRDLPLEDLQTNKQEGIYLQFAGLILLHPFLPRFFTKCGLLAANTFKNPAATAKAIHLLYYLTTNETKPEEYDLPLFKLLCGLPFNVPIDRFVELDNEILEEADALLHTAITHWGALGEVSNTSLQDGFLQREGKLLKTQNGWSLQVETKTLDVLLNQLPWGISMVKLPWMKDLLSINWI